MKRQSVAVKAQTQWVAGAIDVDGEPEDIISYCARVSNPDNQENFDTSGKLLKYCIRKKHWSVFEMSNIVIEINTTRDIGRQILRHRSFHFQEFSQRYADPTQMGWFLREGRLQDEKNRQNSIKLDPTNPRHKVLADEFRNSQLRVIDVVSEEYHKMLGFGFAKEQARALLPEGLTSTKMFMNGTVRDWVHYCMLRMGEETQAEHREIASMIWSELKKYYSFLDEIETTAEITE